MMLRFMLLSYQCLPKLLILKGKIFMAAMTIPAALLFGWIGPFYYVLRLLKGEEYASGVTEQLMETVGNIFGSIMSSILD